MPACAGANLGQQYRTICAALAIAEGTRNKGGHALVVLNDASCMVRCAELGTAVH